MSLNDKNYNYFLQDDKLSQILVYKSSNMFFVSIVRMKKRHVNTSPNMISFQVIDILFLITAFKKLLHNIKKTAKNDFLLL